MSAYRIAVCEDDADVRARISEYCREIFRDWGIELDLHEFASADKLRAALE